MIVKTRSKLDIWLTVLKLRSQQKPSRIIEWVPKHLLRDPIYSGYVQLATSSSVNWMQHYCVRRAAYDNDKNRKKSPL